MGTQIKTVGTDYEKIASAGESGLISNEGIPDLKFHIGTPTGKEGHTVTTLTRGRSTINFKAEEDVYLRATSGTGTYAITLYTA